MKLMAMLGAFFGWQATIFMLLMSSCMGLIVGIISMFIVREGLKTAIPFGPFLSLAAILQLFAGEELMKWYLNTFL